MDPSERHIFTKNAKAAKAAKILFSRDELPCSRDCARVHQATQFFFAPFAALAFIVTHTP